MKKIIVVDDHTIVRYGICEALDAENDFAVIAQADSGRSAIDLALELCPDIMLMDVSMPGLNGIETTRHILANNSNIKIIALTMHSEKVYVKGMLDAGVSGCASTAPSRRRQNICPRAHAPVRASARKTATPVSSGPGSLRGRPLS